MALDKALAEILDLFEKEEVKEDGDEYSKNQKWNPQNNG